MLTHNSTLHAHAKAHTGEKPYVCEHCGNSRTVNQFCMNMQVHILERNSMNVNGWKSLWAMRSPSVTWENKNLGEALWMGILWKAFMQWASFQAQIRIHTETFGMSALRETLRFSTFLRNHLMIHTILNTSSVEEPFSLKILWSTWKIAQEKNFITKKNAGHLSAFHLFLYMETQQDRNLMLQRKFAFVSASFFIGIPCISSSHCWSKYVYSLHLFFYLYYVYYV